MSTSDVPVVVRAPGPLRRLDATGVPALIARLVLGGLFIYMGSVKAKDPGMFLKQIHEYHMVPDGSFMAMNYMAAVLPWMEIACGALLVLGIALRGTSLLLMIMLVGFTSVVALRAYGIHVDKHMPFCEVKFDCGCGGGEIYACTKIMENSGLVLLALFLLWSRPVAKWFTLWPHLVGPRRAVVLAPVKP